MGKLLKVIVYGPPGSGKDTHSQILAKELNLPVFSIGGIMREAIAQKTEIGLQIERYVALGEIAPIEISLTLLRERLSVIEYRKGYIACGFKTLEFAQLYLREDTPTHIVHLVLDDELLRSRLRVRARFDDYDEAIEKRLSIYRNDQVKACAFWKDQPSVQYEEFSTEDSIEEVSQRIKNFIKQ
jgi:adenylate kinase